MAVNYELVTHSPSGTERAQEYAAEEPLAPGEVLQLRGRFWLVESVDEPEGEDGLPRAIAKPARYRIRLRHPDEREELGALRRFRPGSPRLGHALTTIEAGQPISWQVMDEQLAGVPDAEVHRARYAAPWVGEEANAFMIATGASCISRGRASRQYGAMATRIASLT